MGGLPGAVRLVTDDLGDGFLGVGIVDEILAGCCGSDERYGHDVVDRAEQAAGDLVRLGDGVVGEQGSSRSASSGGGTRRHRVWRGRIGFVVNRVAIRWSRAAKVPMHSCRFKVGCPARIAANGGGRIHV